MEKRTIGAGADRATTGGCPYNHCRASRSCHGISTIAPRIVAVPVAHAGGYPSLPCRGRPPCLPCSRRPDFRFTPGFPIHGNGRIGPTADAGKTHIRWKNRRPLKALGKPWKNQRLVQVRTGQPQGVAPTIHCEPVGHAMGISTIAV